jgi:hypothetical protein
VININAEEEEDISDASLKVQCPRKSCMEFWVAIGGEFPHLSRKASNILLPFHNIVPVRYWVFSNGNRQRKGSFYDGP